MSSQDAELDRFRNGVSCAALLENMVPGWRLDAKESTGRALKYRRCEGEILIVNHDGRGWWDPQSRAKGDVFDLVQHLDRGLNFGQVRQVLRRFVGVAAHLATTVPAKKGRDLDRPLQERWTCRPQVCPGSPAWCYLAETRCLPRRVLTVAAEQDAVREGHYGSAWFAHRDGKGEVSHVEIRGPDFKGSPRGGRKMLFRLAGDVPTRLAVTEAPIDALSLAALEGVRANTLYLATGGGMGPGTVEAFERTLSAIAGLPGARLSSATDANAAGDRYAAHHAALAAAAGVAFERLTPTCGADWNDVIKQGRGK